MTLTRCSKCGIEKPSESFRKDKRRSTGLHSWCKRCACDLEHARYVRDGERMRTRLRIAYQRNPEKSRTYNRARYHKRKDAHRNSRLIRIFGISSADYGDLLAQQGGVCAICGGLETRVNHDTVQNLSVDHNHSTGTTRNLLCGNCNEGFGLFKESPVIIEAALVYAKKWDGL